MPEEEKNVSLPTLLCLSHEVRLGLSNGMGCTARHGTVKALTCL